MSPITLFFLAFVFSSVLISKASIFTHTHTHTHFEVAFLMFPIWRSSKQLITQFLCCSKKNSCKTSAEQVLAEAVEIFNFSHAKPLRYHEPHIYSYIVHTFTLLHSRRHVTCSLSPSRCFKFRMRVKVLAAFP